MSELDEVLEHYGVKGMHWGQRKSEASSVGTSSDAALAKKHKTTAKAHGSQALSNAELKLLVERMNLEKQYSTLNPKGSQKAKKFVSELLVGVGKQQAARVVNDIAAKQLAKALSGK